MAHILVKCAKDGAAAATGLKKGDVITKINDAPSIHGLEMRQLIASYNTRRKNKYHL